MTTRHFICFALICSVTSTLIAAEEVALDTRRDVVYARIGDRELTLDIYLPKLAEGERPPLVVWIHGGGWWTGNKRPCRALPLTSEGFAVASIDYRYAQQAVFPAQIYDCKAAIRYLRANADKFGYDAERIGVIGASAGGQLALLLGTSGGVARAEGDVGDFDDASSRVQAVVNLFGPSDLLTFEAIAPERLVELLVRKLVAERLVAQLLGAPPELTNIKARLASPLHQVTADDPPLLSIHGTADLLVPLRQSERIHRAYLDAGLDSTLHVIEDAWHGGAAYTTDDIRAMIAAFFDQHLRAE